MRKFRPIMRKFRPIVRKFRQNRLSLRIYLCVSLFDTHFYISLQPNKNKSPMTEDKIILAQDNKLTLSRQNFTTIEKRCLYFIIKEVRRLYVDRNLEEHESTQKTLFSDMYLTLSHNQLQLLGDEVKDVYNALRKLRNREIEIENEEIWVITAWILQAKHNKKNNMYEVLVSKDILPFLVELASQFTEYSLTVAITLKSTYSQRFYEICCMYRNKGKFFLDIDKLRYILKIEDKKSYQNVAQIKRDILEVAQKELETVFNEGQSDLYFTYRIKDKDGRKILSYWFDIHTRQTEEQKRLDFGTTQAQIRRIMDICSTFIKRDKKYLARVEKELMINPNNAAKVLEKLLSKVNDYPKKEIPAIIRYVLREDFGMR